MKTKEQIIAELESAMKTMLKTGINYDNADIYNALNNALSYLKIIEFNK